MQQSVMYSRRQNKSCDQCRSGKRRCDLLNFERSGDQDVSNSFVSSPCSNCRKWKKRCTINWIREHYKPRTSTCSRRSKGLVCKPGDAIISDAYGDSNAHIQSESIDSTIGDRLSTSTFNDLAPDYAGSMSNTVLNHFDIPPRDDAAILTDSYAYQPSSYDFTVHHSFEQHASSDTDYCPSSSVNSSDDFGSWSTPITNLNSTTSLWGSEPAIVDSRHSSILYDNAWPSKTASPFASHFLAEDYSRRHIKKSLLKIYHDSLEGALSCWLIERNCPYASSPFIDEKEVWSSKWSNRVVTRVRALDGTYLKAGLLSKDEQKQASNVLGAVVMAFAVQWAQTAYSDHSNLSTHLHEHGTFGRNLQKDLWTKSKSALGQAVGNPSFQLVFAQIIFSLTQRPLDSAEVHSSPQPRRHGELASLRRILDDDNGPLFLDPAVRKLHDHQRRLKDVERAIERNPSAVQPWQALGEQDKQTFALLFWLAVMFDTISAAMNRRAFALDDGETKMDDEKIPPAPRLSGSANDLAFDLDGYSGFSNLNRSYLARESQIWGNYFLRQHSRVGDLRKQSTRWPCSYSDAAACLADAAPVKVLVFRRLGHLQDLFYQRAPAAAIEDAISSVLEVVNHWKDTYGLFIGDCAANHENLPVRIQSWYILLASHWHLAILLLADLLDTLDGSNLTLAANRIARQATDFADTLRLRSVYAVSDLGRCSRFGTEESSFSRGPDFHHAVNKAALLTEPWTVVLVRSFAYAAEVLVSLILSGRSRGLFMPSIDLTEVRGRLDDCIDALWLLGRKSDMALSAAKVLQEAVNQA